MIRILTESEMKMVSGGAPGDTYYDPDLGENSTVLMTTVDEIKETSSGLLYRNVDWGYAGYYVGYYWSGFNDSGMYG